MKIYHLDRGERGVRLKLDGRPRLKGWKNFGRRWARAVGVWKIGRFSWISYVYHP